MNKDWNSKKAWLIVDLQYGSTGKGLLAGKLAEDRGPDTLMTAWGPNAGHTFIDATGRKYVHTMLANGIVSPRLKRVMIGPGSCIDPHALLAEVEAAKDWLDLSMLVIHENAAVVTQEHRGAEANTMTSIGSTKKGTGQALVQRIRRNPDDMNTARSLLQHTALLACIVDTEEWLKILALAERVQIEGAQGYSLSMYHGFYPYTTSRDVSTAQVLADCGVPFAMGKNTEVIGTCRTYPIRVANRYLDEKQVGWSGPCYRDQSETSFEAIGQPVELTTVTKLPRRIFTFSEEQIRQAIAVTGAQSVFLNFLNYCTAEHAREIATVVGKYARVDYAGYGPKSNQVQTLDF